MVRTPLYRAGFFVLVICTIIPLVATACVVVTLPDIVPLHFDLEGNINRWGSRWELFVVGGIMAAVNLVDLVCYAKAETLKRYNLLNAPGSNEIRNARIILVVTGVIVVIVHLAVLALIVSSIANA